MSPEIQRHSLSLCYQVWQMIQKNDYGMWMIKIEELSACSQSWQADALLEFVQFG
jgi:hypothetical protein